jgi:aminoglycoside phosphotransferase (APT) family kinase protein
VSINQPDLTMGLTAIADEIAPGGGAVRDLRRLSGGASQETWSFVLAGPDGELPLILRRAPKGARQHENNPGLENEAVLMQVSAEAGVPSPTVRLVLRPEHNLGRGFIMDHVFGETIARKLLRDAAFKAVRPTLARRIGEVMGRIHGIPLEVLPPLRHADARVRLADCVQRYRDAGTPRPVIELAIRWLEDNLPPVRPPRLVHGDLRNGNMIIDPDGLQAVLDWEIAHLGDPMEDLGWICVNSWRFGEIDNPVGGFGPREELFAGYEAAAGVPADPAEVHWWEVLGSLSWGVSCGATGVDDHAQRDRALERAMIGRRASECEIDLLRLLTGEA